MILRGLADFGLPALLISSRVIARWGCSGSARILAASASEAADALGAHPHASGNEWKDVVPLQHHLRDPLPMYDLDRRRRGVAHDHAPLVGEVRIDCPRRIRNPKPFLECRSAARSYLRLVAVRQGGFEAERNQRH